MAYTTINKSSDYFNTVLYTGNGSTQSITGVGFQPDLVWMKRRDAIESHCLANAISGAGYSLRSNGTDAENYRANTLTSFDSDGFSIGDNNEINISSGTFASWNWLGGNGTSSNTDGSITSTVSANTTSGFSVVTYTGTGSNATIGHGLGSVPKFIAVKQLNTTQSWINYHEVAGATNYFHLNLSDAPNVNSTVWNNTAPTSSVFSVGTAANCNQSGGTYVAYCWSEVKGFSRFGSYLGTLSTDYGAFQYCGFKPAFVLIKGSDYAEEWTIQDNKRPAYNSSTGSTLKPNSTAAEDTATYWRVDLLSNGFKVRSNDGKLNYTNKTYIWMAFAEHPLVSSTGTPCTAR